MQDERANFRDGYLCQSGPMKMALRRRAAAGPCLAAASLAVAVLSGTLMAAAGLQAADAETLGPPPELYRKTVDGAVRFLASRQAQDGSLSARIGIGPTALATLGMLRSGRTAKDPTVAKGLAYLEKYTQESGGVYAPGSRIPNYETCVALVCLKEANGDGRYDEILRKAEAYLRGEQYDESRGKDKSNLHYGGVGYGGQSRPDLSNTAYLVDALRAAGAGPNDDAIQKALVFVSRCQNLESEYNTTPYASKVNDGGCYYTCVLSGQDPQRKTGAGGLRSYGAMTYSGLKSMIYAGLSKNDPRVKAAVTWVRKHYDLKSNPGMGDAGLFYYYHTFAKALDACGIDRVEDAKGIKHDWRRELTEELARRQQPDGSWVNQNTRWMEGDPNLATAFALLALSYCRPQASR